MYEKLFLMLTVLGRYSTCQRRIVDGELANAPYAVYLVWDNSSENPYADFHTICGGILLTTQFVLTSAVCLYWHRTQHVIAGYNRYVPNGLGRNDEEKACLKVAKRLITAKNFSEDEHYPPEEWFVMDLGVATLNKPYNFHDKAFLWKCSYKPGLIKLRYETTEPNQGDEVILFGWGSSKYHVPENIDMDMNEEFLRATATVVIDPEECKAIYNLTKFDIAYKFCTDGKASIDINGKYKDQYRRHMWNNGTKGPLLFAVNAQNMLSNNSVTALSKFQRSFRRNGACQNDHGGPIVMYVNGKRHVVGIVTAFLVGENWQCVGPTIGTKFVHRHEYLIKKFKP